MSLIAVGLVGLNILHSQAMPAGDPLKWVNDQAKWKQVGIALMAKAPSDVRNGGAYRKLKYLYREYTDLLIKSGAPLNWDAGGRVRHGLNSFTCGSHSTMLEGLFNGAGIQGLAVGYVRAGISGTAASLAAGVNSDHGALFVVIDGLPVAFDPWLPAFLTNKTYSNGLQLDFGGLPYPLWEIVVRHYGYDQFSTQDPKGQAVVWRSTVKQALEDASMLAKDAPKPPKPERPVGGGHWRLDRISAFTTSLPQYGANSCAAAELQGTFWNWVYEKKGADTVLVRCSLNLNVATSLAFLVPGDAPVIARISEDRFPSGGDSTGWVDVMWTYSKVNGSDQSSTGHQYAGVDRSAALNPENAGPYVPVYQTTMRVPVGVTGEEFRIILSSEAGGVHYIYKWSDTGSVPEEIKKPTFAGRWQTEFGIVEIKLTGRQAKGTYPHDAGRIEGQVSLDGFSITGKWAEAPTFQPPKDSGDLEFRMSEDGKTLTGRYWYGPKKGSADPGKPWNGKRIE